MKHPYDNDYQPSFPALPIVLENSDEGLRIAAENALDGPARMTEIR